MESRCPRCSWILAAARAPNAPCPRCQYDPAPSAPRVVHSRWRRSSTTFGPTGRLAWTGVALGPPALLYWAFGPWGLTMCLTWLVIAVPLLLRSIWAPGRVS